MAASDHHKITPEFFPLRAISVQRFEIIDNALPLVVYASNMHISVDTDLADDRNWIHDEKVSTIKLRSLFNSMQVGSFSSLLISALRFRRF